MKTKIILTIAALAFACANAQAQVNSGSTGSDGALDLSATNGNIVIDMHDHPTGIYNYTYINIPSSVTVTFIPNTANTPVYWLVQSNVVINGTVDVSGHTANNNGIGSVGGNGISSVGGPGGGAGGSGGSNPQSGQGLGGGSAGVYGNYGAGGSFGTQGGSYINGTNSAYSAPIYGNSLLIPLLGGSGGGGSGGGGAGGGGGAILIAASTSIQLNGGINANGGSAYWNWPSYDSSGGSGGGVRLVTANFSGNGGISANGGSGGFSGYYVNGGAGRVRIDAYQDAFGGGIQADPSTISQGSQFIIFPANSQAAQLTVTSGGGVPVSASPTGQILTPDAVLSAQQNNPIPIVVNCANLPLHTLIAVSVKPVNGTAVSATGHNDTGTLSSSTATIQINIPRGGGLIYATATPGN